MAQDALTNAIDLLVAHSATESVYLFRDGSWLMTATMLPSLSPDDRRHALGMLPVATMADRVNHVAFTNVTIGEATTDAVSWLEAPVDPAERAGAPPRLVLYPFVQRPGTEVVWSEPVEMGGESAVFGDVTDALAAIVLGLVGARPEQIDAARVDAVDRLTKLDIAVQMSEEFSTEVRALLARVE